MLKAKPTITSESLLDEMRNLRTEIYKEGQELFASWRPRIKRRAFLIGAQNLAYYLAMRGRDLRELQTALMPFGLSSLGRSESRVLPTLDAVIATLEALNNIPENERINHPRVNAFFRGERMLKRQVTDLFGTMRDKRQVRIMVTFPSEAAENPDFVLDMVERGMDVARINCAHDNPDVWSKMIEHVRAAARVQRRDVKVLMDLGGPKPRTADVINSKKIHVGNTMLLTKAPPKKSALGEYAAAARCTLPEVLDQLDENATVWIDDGKIGCTVERLALDGVVLRVTHAPINGAKIKPEKGLNFPDSDLTISPLTDDDLKALDFAATHADMIGYSFVQDAGDIALLQRELAKRIENPQEVAIIAKIETPRAIRNLPELIVAAAGKQPFGVMIARGDLAIEVGYERTAEMQEEILWLCEAAHVPVIWATQVLERFVKEGMPSRSEMTDAAMSARAECVMLNKGEFAGEAVTILDDLLTRMQQHQSKKTPQLRALRSWAKFVGGSS